MAYRSLEKLFHMDASPARKANAEARAKARFEAESTFRTRIQTSVGELFLAVPRELSVLNERVLRRERAVSQSMRSLPPVAQWAMIRGLVIDEVVSTNDLEGVYSTRRQINNLLQEESRPGGPTEQKRFRELAKLYLGLTDSTTRLPEKPEDVRTIYDALMTGEPLGKHEQIDGKLFRRDGVEIIGAGGRVIHTGLQPESQIIEAIERMLELCSSEDMPETYSAILGHFIFEYAHPFYDGNGRTGRYLLALYLSRPLSTLTALSLSRVIAENRSAYYRSFREAEHPLNHGELTLFVMNMLETIGIAQEELEEGIAVKKGLLNDLESSLDAFATTHELSEKETDAVYMLAQLDLFGRFPEATWDEVARHLGLGRQQTRDYMSRLEGKGLVVRPSKRPLKFALTENAAAELGLRG